MLPRESIPYCDNKIRSVIKKKKKKATGWWAYNTEMMNCTFEAHNVNQCHINKFNFNKSQVRLPEDT